MTFRPMRRTDRQMDPEEADAFLAEHNWGVLSVMGDDGFPYGVPVNYGYSHGKLYIHSTNKESHKLDALRSNPKVCFTVVGQHELLEQEFSTKFSSVILFGTAQILTGETEKRVAAIRMMHGLAPSVEDAAIADCGRMQNIVMIEITPEHISGKYRK